MAGASPVSRAFVVGDLVDVRKHGRANVIELGPAEGDGEERHAAGVAESRVLVRYQEDGTTRWVQPKFLRPLFPASKPILVARTTTDYRSALVHNVEWTDVCLEIGCHEGITTNIISNRTAHVVGIDTSADVVAIAAPRFPHLTFRQMDGLDTAATAALLPPGRATYTRIAIDISGKAPLELICAMLAAQRAAFPAAVLHVKNEALYDDLAALEAQQQQQQAQQTDAQQGGGQQHQLSRRQAGRQERLRALLGDALLAECEVFRHPFAPKRTRPLRPRRGAAGSAGGVASGGGAGGGAGADGGEGEAPAAAGAAEGTAAAGNGGAQGQVEQGGGAQGEARRLEPQRASDEDAGA